MVDVASTRRDSEGKLSRDIFSIGLMALKTLFFAIQIVDYLGTGGTRSKKKLKVTTQTN